MRSGRIGTLRSRGPAQPRGRGQRIQLISQGKWLNTWLIEKFCQWRGLDLVNIGLGWNMGDVLGVGSDLRIEEAALLASTIARAVHSLARHALRGRGRSDRQSAPARGGCQIARVDGYIGGSTIDRVPSESAIEAVTAAFKAIGALHGVSTDSSARAIVARSRWRYGDARRRPRALGRCSRGSSQPTIRCSSSSSPARPAQHCPRAAHRERTAQSQPRIAQLPGAGAGRLRLDLFGCMAGAHPSAIKHQLGRLEVSRGSTVLLEGLEALDIEVQRRLVETVETGLFWRIGVETPIPLDVRLMATSQNDLGCDGDPRFDARFVEWISRFAIVVPPPRERLDDLPMLIQETLNQTQRRDGPRKSLDPSAYRTLATYHWPGNLREWIAVLERAVVVSPGQTIGPAMLLIS